MVLKLGNETMGCKMNVTFGSEGIILAADVATGKTGVHARSSENF